MSSQILSAFTMAPRKQTPSFTIPFVYYPHIVFYNNQYKEVCCPVCDGNCRGDSAHDPMAGPKAFTIHLGTTHSTSNRSIYDLLEHSNLRVLTANEVQQILDGDGESVIQRKKVAKVDGQQAQVVQHGAPIPHYPTVVKLENGTYDELHCGVCKGNARIVKGGHGASNPKHIFLVGMKGVGSHISQMHKTKNVTWKEEWVKKHCDVKILDDEMVQKLKKDVTGGLIEKVPVREVVAGEDDEMNSSQPEAVIQSGDGSVLEGHHSQSSGEIAATDTSNTAPLSGSLASRNSPQRLSLSAIHNLVDSSPQYDAPLSEDYGEPDMDSRSDDSYDPTSLDDFNELERRFEAGETPFDDSGEEKTL